MSRALELGHWEKIRALELGRSETANQRVKRSEQSYVLETMIYKFFFTHPHPSRHINARPHFVLPVHMTGRRGSLHKTLLTVV